MVKSRQPLRHAHVTGVFSLEKELEKPSGSCFYNLSAIPRQATICRDTQQILVTIGYQPQRHLVVSESRLRRAKNRAYEVVIKVWRSHGKLRLLEREHTMKKPRGLLECGKANLITVKN